MAVLLTVNDKEPVKSSVSQENEKDCCKLSGTVKGYIEPSEVGNIHRNQERKAKKNVIINIYLELKTGLFEKTTLCSINQCHKFTMRTTLIKSQFLFLKIFV